jgi:hypothetical protein
MSGDLVILLAVWLVCGIAAGIIAQDKGDDATGAFALGLLLGPIGIVLAIVKKPQLPLDPGAAQPLTPPMQRCTAVAAGWQCVLPAGHSEPHSAR